MTELTAEDWKLINKGLTRRASGYFPQGPMLPVLGHRSEREKAALTLLVLNPRINSIEFLPEKVTLIVAGKRRDYFPGYRLRSGHQVAMVDVLSAESAKSEKRQVLTDTLTRIYAERGVTYKVMPEADVFRQPRLSNARFILGYGGVEPDTATEHAVVAMLAQCGERTVAELANALPTSNNVRATVFGMATRKQLAVDLWAENPDGVKVRLVSWRGDR